MPKNLDAFTLFLSEDALVAKGSHAPWPPNSNHMQRTSKSSHRYDTSDYKNFKKMAEIYFLTSKKFKKLRNQAYFLNCNDKQFFLRIDFVSKSWYKKDGTLRKKRDVSNRLKPFEDALSRALGIDDAQNLKIFLQKRNPPKNYENEYVDFWVYELQKKRPASGGLVGKKEGDANG